MAWGAISVYDPSRLHIVQGTINGAKLWGVVWKNIIYIVTPLF